MFVAKVIFYGPDTGGRQTPPQPGYHPQIKAGDEYTSCRIESLTGVAVFDFDVEHLVSLELLFPDVYAGRFVFGDAVAFYEGSHQVGRGRILDAL
jgi:hypothetical protein